MIIASENDVEDGDYEDDDEMLGKINVNTLVTTGQFDVGSTPEMAKI